MKKLINIPVLVIFNFLLLILSTAHQNIFAGDFWKAFSLYDRRVLSMAEDSKGNLYYSCVSMKSINPDRGIYKSTDNGETWEYIGINHIPELIHTLKISDDDVIYAGINYTGGTKGYGAAFRSDDYGKTWKNINEGLLSNMGDYPSILGFTFSKNGDLFAISDYYGIIKSTNKGDNWERIGFPDYFGILDNRASIICNKDDQLIASCYYGIFLYDLNSNINKIIFEDVNQETRVFDMALNSKNWIFASTMYDSTIYSSDNGKTWNAVLYNGHGIQCSFIKTDYQDNLFVGYIETYTPLKSRIIKSIDNGLSWINMNYNFPDTFEVTCMFISQKGYLFLPTPSKGHGNMLYRSAIPVVTVSKAIQEINQIVISPIPVSDYLTIRFEGSQSVEIYSLLGTKLIESDFKDKIDVSGLPPGIYFIRLGDKVSKFVKI